MKATVFRSIESCALRWTGSESYRMENKPTSYHSYPSIYNIGHRAVQTLFDSPVLIEEKVDGSQFSFGVFNGEVKCRSKGAKLIVDAPEKMFAVAVNQVLSIKDKLIDGWTYRGEYLKTPKHNTLAYDRVPTGNIIIFDVNTGEEVYLPYADKKAEAERLGFETVPIIYEGMVQSASELRDLLERVSILGGQKIEGIVVKNYDQFGPDKKALFGKFVSEAFKEVHQGEWKKNNPTGADILQQIITSLRTPARWSKAVQHLKESGSLEGSPRDIGNLIKEAQSDIKKECMDEITKALLSYYMPQIMRGVVGGLPEWYKQQLLEGQFTTHDE